MTENEIKDLAIKFAEFCSDKCGRYEDSSNLWWKYNEDHENYTTEELYKIFIKNQ